MAVECARSLSSLVELRPDLSSSVSVSARLRSWSCCAGSGAVDQLSVVELGCPLESTSVGACRLCGRLLRVAHSTEWFCRCVSLPLDFAFAGCRSDRSGSAAPPLSGRALTGARPALYRLSLCLRFRLPFGRPFGPWSVRGGRACGVAFRLTSVSLQGRPPCGLRLE